VSTQTIQRKFAGDTLSKRLKFYGDADALFDPDTISIVIKDPSGATKATKTKTDLTYETKGTYKLLYNIPADAATGLWSAVVTATRTLNSLQNTERFTFYVQS
jgi:uncharacterized protein YfaS (alpha-2-macroglobulin family)